MQPSNQLKCTARKVEIHEDHREPQALNHLECLISCGGEEHLPVAIQDFLRLVENLLVVIDDEYHIDSFVSISCLTLSAGDRCIVRTYW